MLERFLDRVMEELEQTNKGLKVSQKEICQLFVSINKFNLSISLTPLSPKKLYFVPKTDFKELTFTLQSLYS